MPLRVAIVGAGIAGLSAAHRIRELQPDAELTILESRDRVGGVLRSESASGYLCEHAANGFLSAAGPGAASLCRELGVDVVPAGAGAKRRWVFRHGALRQVPTSPPALFKTDLLSWRGRLRLLGEPFARRAPAREETVGEFGRRRLGAEATDALIAPFVLGVWAGDAERLSFPAAFPRIAALETRHGGLLRGMLASKRAGGTPPVLSAPRAGMEALPIALAARLEGKIRTRTRVEGLERDKLGWRLRLAGGQTLDADKVVLAAPPSIAAGLVEPLAARMAARLREIVAVGAMVVHVGLAAKGVEHQLDGFGFLVAEGESPRCLGCVFESSVWPERAPPGQVLLRFIYGGERDPQVLELDDAAVAAVVEADLDRILGIQVKPGFVRVVRWPRAIPQYRLGHLERVADLESLARSLGLVLAGSGYHGVSINELVADADRVARTLIST